MLLYYILFYIENWIMFALWITETKHTSKWFYPTSIVTVACGMIFHIIFQILYYKKFHPKSDEIPWCEPLTKEACWYVD